MKIKIVVVWILTVFVLSIGVNIANASTKFVGVASNGSLCIVTKYTKVLFEPGVLTYGNSWKEAYKHPGKVVPVGKVHKKYVRDGLLHLKVWKVGNSGLVYDIAGIHVLHKVVQQEEPKLFSSYYLFWLASTVAFVLLSVLVITDDKKHIEITPILFAGSFLVTVFGSMFSGLTVWNVSITAAIASFVAISFLVSVIILGLFLTNSNLKISNSAVNWISGCLFIGYFIAMFISYGFWFMS